MSLRRTALLVQWDGYVANPPPGRRLFSTATISAPSGSGSGGTSRRQWRLLVAVAPPARSPAGSAHHALDNEDLTIAARSRSARDAHGIRFADEELADRFASRPHTRSPAVRFMACFNFCRVVAATSWRRCRMFSDAIARSPQLAQLFAHCIALGQWHPAIALARRRLTAVPEAPKRRCRCRKRKRRRNRLPLPGATSRAPAASGKRSSIAMAPSENERASMPAPPAMSQMLVIATRWRRTSAGYRCSRTRVSRGPRPLAGIRSRCIISG